MLKIKEGKWGKVSPEDPAFAKVRKQADTSAAKFDKGEQAPEGGWAPPSPEKKKPSPGMKQMTNKGVWTEEDKEGLAQTITEQVLAVIANMNK